MRRDNKGSNKQLSWFMLLCCVAPAFSAANTPNGALPLPPRVSIWGSTGTNSFGEGDAMLPMWGNANQAFFSDVTAKYGRNGAWLASLGLGQRKIIQDNTLLGAYFFTDYNRSSYANYFTVLNPGIEWMTNLWDAHLNGYVPVGKRNVVMDRSIFVKHTEYDRLINLIEGVGPGADLEIGRTFSLSNQKRLRVFAGSYYFNPKYTSNINGVEAGFEMPLTYKQASVELRNSYDNVHHNTFLVTLRLTFDGLDKTGAPDIQDRMLDRIPRHLGNLYNGDGIPSEKTLVGLDRASVVRDNIWFFDVNGAPSNIEGFKSCTYEHPCSGLTQTQIDAINGLASNANFYLSSGTYNNPSVGSGFNFYNGQSIYGRTLGFNQLATGNARPLLNDSLLLNGNNNVSNVRVFANSEQNITTGGTPIAVQTGLLVKASATGMVNVDNTDIIANATTLNAAAAINNSPAATLNIINTTLATNTINKNNGLAVGIVNGSSGMVNIEGSYINIMESDAPGNFNLAFGIVNNENGAINMANTDITVTSFNAGLTAGILNNSTVGAGNVNVIGSNITILADNSSLAAAIFNQANNIAGIGGTVNVDQSILSVLSNNNGGGIGAGVFNSAQSTANITNTTINSSGNDGIITGIFNTDPLGTVNIQNDTISINLSGTAFGFPIINVGTLNDNGGNQCFQDGMSVPC